jgi:hypothetical protein
MEVLYMRNKLLLISAIVIITLALIGCARGEAQPQFPGQSQEMLPLHPEIHFNADRTTIQPGECVTLEWDVIGQDFWGVELNGHPVPPKGQQVECPPHTTEFVLAVDVGDDMLHRSVFIEVMGTGQPPGQPQQPGQQQQPQQGCDGPPVFTHFEAQPPTINAGQSTRLEWGPVTNGHNGPLVKSVVLTPGNFGDVGSPGSVHVSPAQTTTYVLTANGCGGTATKTVTVNVNKSNQPPGGGGWSGPPKVTNVKVYFPGSQPSLTYNGPCPTTITFVGDITVDGPCTVKYRWVRSDGVKGIIETAVFTAAGAQQVSDTWTLGGSGWTGATFWEQIEVLTPLPMMSNQAKFTLNCNP